VIQDFSFVDFVILRLYNTNGNVIDESMLIIQYNAEFNTKIDDSVIKFSRQIIRANDICIIDSMNGNDYYKLTSNGNRIAFKYGNYTKYLKYKSRVKLWLSIDKILMYILITATLVYTILSYLK